MSHVKQQVRDGVKARLATVTALAGAHNASRLARSLQDNEFPAAFVAVSETASRVDKNPEGQRTFRRDLNVVVKVAVKDEGEDAEDTLDECCVAIEKALVESSSIGLGPLANWAYGGTSLITPDAVEDGLMLSVSLNYTCSVLTLDSAPETNLYAA